MIKNSFLISEVLKDMKQVLMNDRLDSKYIIVINYLLEIYILLKKNIILLDYYVSKNQHYISLKLDEENYFVNLNVTNISLEFLFADNFEKTYFFDDE